MPGSVEVVANRNSIYMQQLKGYGYRPKTHSQKLSWAALGMVAEILWQAYKLADLGPEQFAFTNFPSEQMRVTYARKQNILKACLTPLQQ